MIMGYNNMVSDIYRMQQPTLNPGYINHGFINRIGQTPQLPMQMFSNMNMNMNMNSATPQHFQQHMPSPQSNNVFNTTYGYSLGSLNNMNVNHVNGVMRR